MSNTIVDCAVDAALATLHNLSSKPDFYLCSAGVEVVVRAACQGVEDQYVEALADKARLTKELDVLLNGEGGALRPALCDIVSQVQREGIKSTQYRGPVTAHDETLAAEALSTSTVLLEMLNMCLKSMEAQIMYYRVRKDTQNVDYHIKLKRYNDYCAVGRMFLALHRAQFPKHEPSLKDEQLNRFKEDGQNAQA